MSEAIAMPATHSQTDLTPTSGPPPIVIVGNGPAGMRAARELLKRLPDQAIILYGEERHPPYNRVRLSSWLAGELDWDALTQPLSYGDDAQVSERFGVRVQQIDREQKCIVDSTGVVQPFEKLLLATGSQPHIPELPGLDLSGVFTFRSLDDTNRLLARRASSRHTIVIGGGLLGLEAARGMQRHNTRVTVIEHADRLLPQQLDLAGSAQLLSSLEQLGIKVLISCGVASAQGNTRIERVQLSNGETLPCDTLIIATGIRANLTLAKQAGLAFNRGIIVDDRMRTSDPDIYAVGECAEHRGQLYGFVAPGLEQAGVAVADMAGVETHYPGSIAASRLKVVGTQVFSMGPMGIDAVPGAGTEQVFTDLDTGAYRKLLIHRNRLAGAIMIGPTNEINRLQSAISEAQWIWPWQRLRFSKTGRVWPESDSQSVASWPAAALVCQCMSVDRGTLSHCIAAGATTLEAVSRTTNAATVCGSCKPLVQELLGDTHSEPVPMHRSLLALAVVSLIAALAMLLGPNLPYASSVQQTVSIDIIWRNHLIKQITGFSILGLFSVALLLSLRKRIPRLQTLGNFATWRMVHIVLGLLVIVALVAHTGLRLGHGLNFLLMLSFTLTLLVGAVSTGVISLEHRVNSALAIKLRANSILLHILLFWPVPVLLGWHIFKTYWY